MPNSVSMPMIRRCIRRDYASRRFRLVTSGVRERVRSAVAPSVLGRRRVASRISPISSSMTSSKVTRPSRAAGAGSTGGITSAVSATAGSVSLAAGSGADGRRGDLGEMGAATAHPVQRHP